MNLSPNMVTAYNMSVCNNACWSTGEIAVAFPAEVVAPFVAGPARVRLPRHRMLSTSRNEGSKCVG